MGASLCERCLIPQCNSNPKRKLCMLQWLWSIFFSFVSIVFFSDFCLFPYILKQEALKQRGEAAWVLRTKREIYSTKYPGFSTLPNIDWEHWNNLPILSHKDWHCTNYKCGGKNKEQWSLSIKHLQTILAIFYILYLQAVFGRRHNWTVHCMPWWIHIYKKVSNHCMEKHDNSSVTFELSLLLL